MPNGNDSHLSPEQVRQKVDQIMDHWRSYHSFAPLLDALMDANGLGNPTLARQLTRQMGRTLSKSSVRQFRCGEREPSYSFIEDLLATNVLKLDSHRIRPAVGEQPAGNHRLALFSAAGLIEVTPASIRQWNQEVLSGFRRRIVSDSARPPLRWGDLMTKLLSFHMQGGRRSYDDIANGCNVENTAVHLDSDCATPRLLQLLRNARTPSEGERRVLYHYAGLEEVQIAAIEDGIATGTIPLGFTRRRTAFAAALASILDKLRSHKIPLAELAHRSVRLHVPGGDAILQTNLSAWRHGREQPTLAKLRSLTAVLRQLGHEDSSGPVTPAEIDSLLAAGGFRPEQLTDTTHDIIARIDEQTLIKPLLRALQLAIDTSRPMEEVHQRGAELGHTMPSVDMLRKWEESGLAFPTGEQVRNLLQIHNHMIRQNGFPSLSEEEIAKVVAVAERDHVRWQALSHTEKLAERRPHPRRQPPSAFFDGVEHDR